MKHRNGWKRALPALAGAVIIGVIALVVLITRSSDRVTPSTEPAAAAGSGGARERPALDKEPGHSHDHLHGPEEELVDVPMTLSDDDKRRTGLVFGPESDPEIRAAVEEQRKDWKPLTYDEMVEKSRPFLETFALRERTLEAQIAAAEAAGDDARAGQRRIELERLRLRKAELERALSENKLP